jgi:all-trans-8'-apo-beta-carotenal 15,15'-oxygenase
MTAATLAEDGPLDLQEAYRRSNESVTEELDVRLELLAGAVPEGLRGVLVRNGPGRMECHGQPYGHPFDGDGHLNRFAFDDAGIGYRNRYVRTREFLAEESARRILYRNFGTNIPGGLTKNLLRMRFKNAANTSVLWHGGRLHALWEGGVPHRIDPVTLDTLARDDLGGALRNDLSFVDRLLTPELPFSAHPRRDPVTGELFNFGVASGRTPSLMLYRLDPGGACSLRERMPLPALGFMHDFVLTPRYRVFFFTPSAFDLGRTLLGLSPPVDTLHSLDGPTTILLLPRRGTQARVLTAPSCFIFHFAGGFEDGDRVIVDAMRMDRYPDLGHTRRTGHPGGGMRPLLTRFVLDPRAGTVEERRLGDYPGELPMTDLARTTQPHRYVWAIARPPEQREPISTGLVKVDCERAASTFRDFAPLLTGEPIFVARPGGAAEDDGWLLSMCYDPVHHAGELLVLDASDLRTLCRARMPHPTPLGFHGTWIPA